MSGYNFGLKSGQSVLIINSVNAESHDIVETLEKLKKLVSPGGVLVVENVVRLSKGDHITSRFDVILSGVVKPQSISHNIDLLGVYSKLLKPLGRLIVHQALSNGFMSSGDELTSQFKLSGLTNISPRKTVELNENDKEKLCLVLKCDNVELVQIEGQKPNFEIGSSAKISLGPVSDSVAAVWKLDNTVDDDIIDADELLDESDLKKPDPSSLKVCGTTGKRKACKNCSCGLADELEKEEPSAVEPPQKSACGNCYLGDAFRCASCPYLGMPAFKPGEKIQLSGTQLKADV